MQPGTPVTLGELFDIRPARSGGIDDYGPGDVPFVTSSEENNGVVAYVAPEAGDLVFQGPAIAISGLGHATVQLGRFLPKGNGGDSLTILRPLDVERMTVKQLIAFCAVFNIAHKWRFSYGRKCSVARVKQLECLLPLPNVAAAWANEAATLSRLHQAIMQIAAAERD